MGYKKCITLLAVCAVLWAAIISSTIYAEDRFADTATRQMAIELSEFIQIPGPNPILKPGPRGSWDDNIIETSDAFEDIGTYYLYYHGSKGDFYGDSGVGEGKGYQIGVATANHPLGPFKKYHANPILEIGPKGSWEDRDLACAMVIKEADDKYYMVYFGRRIGLDGVGLATAPHPLGPWEKYEGNPIMEDFGYVGGVVKVDQKFYLYTEYPISYRKPDYGPMALATADSLEGPWTRYPHNPVMGLGQPGDWDDGGISEAEVVYQNGLFHIFYGGTRIYDPARHENIGYAYSFDGFRWFKYSRNPVASRQDCPNVAAFSEVHNIIELPLIYLYHTQRYSKRDNKRFPWMEDVGVQVLATQRPFSIDMPALYLENLVTGATTNLDDASPICLSNVNSLSLTAECTYTEKAKKPIRIHVRASYDGLQYDTSDLYTLDNVLQPGQPARKTFQLNSKVRFIKVMVENLDKSNSVSDVKIIATLGG